MIDGALTRENSNVRSYSIKYRCVHTHNITKFSNTEKWTIGWTIVKTFTFIVSIFCPVESFKIIRIFPVQNSINYARYFHAVQVALQKTKSPKRRTLHD